MRPDGHHHTFSFSYDPKGNQGGGTVRFTLDGQTKTANLRPGHKAEGAMFNRLGIFSNQIPGRKMTAYFDDLTVTINGRETTHDFSKDPGWDEFDNRAEHTEYIRYGGNNFGYSPTSHAGGVAGEIGGRFWRVPPQRAALLGHYGDATIGTLTMDMPLHASGQISLRQADTDDFRELARLIR